MNNILIFENWINTENANVVRTSLNEELIHRMNNIYNYMDICTNSCSDSYRLEINKMIYDYKMICVEDYDVLRLFQTMYYNTKNLGGQDIVTQSYASILSLFDKALLERNFQTIHSVFRLDRYLVNNIINQNKS